MLATCALMAPAPAAGRGSPNTAALQTALKSLHHYGGRIDGMNGARTKRAVRRFQRAHHLHADGVAGARTKRALGRRGRPALGRRAMSRGDTGWDVAALQWLLRKRGFSTGHIDGGFGGMTDSAVRRAQSKYGIGVDGIAGSGTIGALKRGRGPARHPQTGGGRSNVSNPIGAVRFLRPVHGPITSPFGMRWGRMHTGVDFGAPAGAPISAAGRGAVSFAGWNAGGYGNLVVIDHRLGYQTWYAHMSSVAVHVGQSVSGGTRIGYVGATGHATGPHLHFEVRHDGIPVDPAPYLLTTYAAKLAPGSGGVTPHDGCAPKGRIERDPARARLVDCR